MFLSIPSYLPRHLFIIVCVYIIPSLYFCFVQFSNRFVIANVRCIMISEVKQSLWYVVSCSGVSNSSRQRPSIFGLGPYLQSQNLSQLLSTSMFLAAAKVYYTPLLCSTILVVSGITLISVSISTRVEHLKHASKFDIK